MTLEALLTTLEKWQVAQAQLRAALDDDNGRAGSPIEVAQERAMDMDSKLSELDIVAFSTIAQQHAAQLREEAEDGDAGDGISCKVLRAAAEFLQPSGAQEQAGKEK